MMGVGKENTERRELLKRSPRQKPNGSQRIQHDGGGSAITVNRNLINAYRPHDKVVVEKPHRTHRRERATELLRALTATEAAVLTKSVQHDGGGCAITVCIAYQSVPAHDKVRVPQEA